MRNLKVSLAAVAAVAALTGTASAGGSPNTFGIGAEAMFANSGDDIGGISANYDFGDFHLGGFLGVDDPAGANNTRLELGVRFYYHLHASAMADFGVGGTLAYANTPVGGASDEKNDEVYLAPGMQLRAFIASNVALSFTAGISLGLGDADGVSLDGRLTGGAGVHYYFF